MTRAHRYDFRDLLRRGGETAGRLCDAPDCDCLGEYRAPKSRDQLREYYWFCLDHVREYNKRWNYYAGMNENEIEAHLRHDTTWRRPTWSFRNKQRHVNPGLKDEFGLFDDLDDAAEARARNGKSGKNGQEPPENEAGIRERRAFAELEIDPPVADPSIIKMRYKTLVKLHHPDANGGSRDAEERLKRINEAYNVLKTRYFA
ncbi:MAG: DnaJ domain-containing protein [Alphaproteobacteria bacterium]|nr:DnaJ domain-containing protein [Alphaproteobacteria bacterium]